MASIAGAASAGGAASHHDIAGLVQSLGLGTDGYLRILLPAGSGANVAPVAEQFRHLTGIEIRITEVPVDDVDVQLALDNLSGTQTFDLALPATFSIPDLVEDGVLAPLDGMAAYDEILASRQTSLFTTGDTFDGANYGFQTDGDAYVMFYNTDFWDAAQARRYEDRFGAPLRVPQTWAELDQQMLWFHRPDQGQFGGMLFRNPNYVAWEWWIRFHARGIWPLAPNMTPQLANDAGVGALEDMIRASDFLAPEAANAGLFDNWNRYAHGDVYANVGWGGSQKFFNKPGSGLRGKLAFGKTPGGLVGDQLLTTPYFNWGWNYVVLAGSSKPDLALIFAAFATCPDMSTLAVRQQDGFFDPFRAEHYADPGIIDAYSSAFLDVHQESMETAIPDLYLARQGEYFLSLSKWIARALNGLTAPDVALARVEQQWNIITAQVGRDKQIQRWGALRSKYPTHARRLLVDL
nr:extracellular solute-binding protein [Octadecabacter dasysiphoniae]